MHKLRIAAIADIHVKESGHPDYSILFSEISQKADVLVICGDITEKGTVEETHHCLNQIKSCTIPIVMVLGNHEYESNKQEEISKLLIASGIHLLDGSSVEIAGIGFAGVKGFCGGFEPYVIANFGEEIEKSFYYEGSTEAEKLDAALAQLTTKHKVALIHFSPIRATVTNEPVEIYPFLGNSLLEHPLNKHQVDIVFHGHAHIGPHEGTTRKGIPVYNVSYPLMINLPNSLPYKLIEI